jgi:hypothetical protein
MGLALLGRAQFDVAHRFGGFLLQRVQPRPGNALHAPGAHGLLGDAEFARKGGSGAKGLLIKQDIGDHSSGLYVHPSIVKHTCLPKQVNLTF